MCLVSPTGKHHHQSRSMCSEFLSWFLQSVESAPLDGLEHLDCGDWTCSVFFCCTCFQGDSCDFASFLIFSHFHKWKCSGLLQCVYLVVTCTFPARFLQLHAILYISTCFFKKNIVIVHLLYCKQQGGVCLGFASCECKSRVTLMEHNTVEALQPQQTQFCGDERQSVMRLH